MNEIERAIELISAGEIDYSGVFDPAINKDVETIILEALREKQERENGCAVCSCEYHQELCAEVVRYHSSDFATQEKVDVHYCPMCGKRLEAQHERD